MKYIALILVILTALALAGLVRTTLRHVDRNPETMLEDARHYLTQPEPAFSRALSDLDLALAAAQRRQQSELTAEILLERGSVYRRMRSFPKAREDYQRVLSEFRPDDPSIQLELLSLDLYAGEFERGLESTNQLIESNPELSAAWAIRGRFLLRLARGRRAEAYELIHAGLPDELAARANSISGHLMGMELTDPERIARQHELRGLFKEQDEAVARAVMRLIDLAAADAARAREAFAQSFRGGISRDAVHEYLSILREAGYRQETIDFGMTVSNYQDVASFPDTMALLMKSLTEIGRPGTACDLVEQRFSKRVLPDADFLTSWCYSLMRAERWQRLVSTAGKLRQSGNRVQRSLADYYTGLAYAKRDNPRQAAIAFFDYLSTEDRPEPPGSTLAYVHRTLAARNELIGAPGAEMEALIAAVSADPDADGTAWLRIAEVVTTLDPDNLFTVERALTHAIRLMPEREEELMPIWRKLGERRLGQSGTSMDLLVNSLRRRGLCAPAVTVGPYELFRLMELYREREQLGCVVTCGERLLLDYPGFRPALDGVIDATLALGDYPAAAQRMLDHLSVSGNDETTIAKFDALPPGTLSPDQVLELMAHDPAHAGRLRIAEDLRAAGHPDRALGALVSLTPEQLGEAGRLLAGHLMVETGDWAGAVGMLNGIAPDAPQYPEALLLKVRSAALADRDQVFEAFVTELKFTEVVDRDLLLDLARELWLLGRSSQSEQLLVLLDERPDTRTHEVMRLLGMNAMLEGDYRVALESFERAEAFDDSGHPPLGRLLVAVQNEDWAFLPAYVRDLDQTALATGSPLAQAALIVLDERMDEAHDIVQNAIDADPEEPIWFLLEAIVQAMRIEVIESEPRLGEGNEEYLTNLLYGHPAGSRDPRQVLGLVLALATPGWELWAASSWNDLAADEELALWPAYLAARGLSSVERYDEAAEIAQTVTERWPTFGPGWELLEDVQLQRRGRWDHIDLVRLRQRRRTALGERPGEEAEEALVRAWQLDRAADFEGALEEARRAVELDGDLLPAQQKLAQLLEGAGFWREALVQHRELSLSAPPEMTPEVVEAYLEYLERAHSSAPALVPRATISAELEILGRSLPTDPLIALARANEELQAENAYSAVRVQRAYEQLREFRERTQYASLEDLRPGSTRPWMEFHVRLDPQEAERFVRTERRKRPGMLDLWLMLGETLIAQDRFEEAIEHYETVLAILPDATTRRQVIALLAQYGNDLARLEEHAETALRIEDLRRDPEISYYRARALINFPGKQRNEGIEVLERLWRDIREGDYESPIPYAEVGRLYGVALSLRGYPKDRELAQQVLTEVSPLIEDPIQQNLTDAMAHLARHTLRP